jgi:hypothetical protein
MKKIVAIQSFSCSPYLIGVANDVAVWRSVFIRKIACIVLCAYALMLFKPVLPLFADAMAHTFNENRHLMVVHEEHGSFHVHYETVKATGSSGKEQSKNTGKITVDDDLFTIAELAYSFPLLGMNVSPADIYSCHCSSPCPFMIYPPPKV